MSRTSYKKPLTCPLCTSPVFIIEGYHEFRKIYDSSRRDPVLATTGGIKDFVTYAYCAGCRQAVTDYLMEAGVFDMLYEIQEFWKVDPWRKKK